MLNQSTGTSRKSSLSVKGGNAMPNWAYTTYKIKGGEEEVAALHQTIKDLDQREESGLLPWTNSGLQTGIWHTHHKHRDGLGRNVGRKAPHRNQVSVTGDILHDRGVWDVYFSD